MFIDTHTHIYDEAFDRDGGGKAAVERALQMGVEAMILPCVDMSSVEPMHRLAEAFPGTVFMALGLHPTELPPTGWQQQVDSMLSLLDSAPGRYCAIGEVGLDLYWDKSRIDDQLQALDYQLNAARQRCLPVIIHCREALDPLIEVLQGHHDIKGVMHSFTGSAEDVRRVRSVADMHFALNGVATFKNCKVTDAVEEIGLDRLLLETDSPYLAPVPHRGKRNESAYVPLIAEHISRVCNIPLDDLARYTTGNARELFNLTPL